MIWLLILVLLAFAIYYAIQYYAMKHALQDVEKQLQEMKQDITHNQILHIPLPNRDIEALSGSMNAILEDMRKEQQEYRQQEKAFQEQLENISHDLRTPLTVILGYLSYLQKDQPQGQDEQQECLRTIERKARAMEVLVNEFYTFSRLHAKDYEVQMQEVDINRLVKETVLDYYQLLNDAALQIDVLTKNHAVYVKADTQCLQRIFSNLLQNVCRYAQSFFRLEIVEQKQSVTVFFINDCDKKLEGDADHIFDRFYKQDSARSQEGTGLGLTVAKGLAEAMQGSISASVLQEERNKQTVYVLKIAVTLQTGYV